MKKLLRKKSLFLVALFVGLCMPMMAQETRVERSFAQGGSLSGNVGSSGVVTYSAIQGDFPQAPQIQTGYLQLYAYDNYGANKLVISSTDGYLIKSVKLTVSENYNGGVSKASSKRDGVSVASSVGTLSTEVEVTINGAGANEVSVYGTRGELRIRKIEVSYVNEPVYSEEDLPDTEREDLEPVDLVKDGSEVYYIRNVATGLYVKYGGQYAMHAIEGRAAHPFKIYENTDGTCALASIHGFFSSMYYDVSLFMDIKDRSKSKWIIDPVENEPGVYNLIGEMGRALSSVGDIHGILELPTHDETDIFQKWEFVTEDYLRAEMEVATVDDLIDVTPIIKSAAFDRADHREVVNMESEEGKLDDPFFFNEIKVLEEEEGQTDVPTENDDWKYAHSYSNNWVGFRRIQQYGAMWSDDIYAKENLNVNGIGLSRNNIHDKYEVKQYLGVFPAGTYTFSYQAFYTFAHGHDSYRLREDEEPYMQILTAQEGEVFSTAVESKILPYEDEYLLTHINSGGDEKGNYIGTKFRDDRNFARNIIQFTLGEESEVMINIHKPSNNSWAVGGNYQWILAFDDFSLVYQGNNRTTVIDQAQIFYDRVKRAYLNATDKLKALANGSYGSCTVNGEECNHWGIWNDNIENVVSVNGLTIDGQVEQGTYQKIAYLNGEKIDNSEKFIVALAEIAKAYNAALKVHESHEVDRTGKIVNPSFDDPKDGNYLHGWTVFKVNGDFIPGDVGAYPNSNPTYQTEGVHRNYLFNSWNGDAAPWAVGVWQTIDGLTPGLYQLTALVTSFGPGEGGLPANGPGNTVYIRGNGYHKGVEAKTKTKFEADTLLFLVEEDGIAEIGAVGGHNRDIPNEPHKYYYYDEGCFFKADNFQLSYVCDLPNGRLKLALDEANAAKEAFDVYGVSSISGLINEYQSKYDKLEATAEYIDDWLEVIHKGLQTAAKLQQTNNADLSYAIADHNFEWKNTYGSWTFTQTADADVKPQSNDTYKTAGADGRFLLNNWSQTAVASQSGWNPNDLTQPQTFYLYHPASTPLKQTINDLPNGRYELTVMVSTDAGNQIVVKANSETVTFTENNEARIGDFVTLQFDVTKGKLDLEVSSVEKSGTGTLTYMDRKVWFGYSRDEKTVTKNFKYKPWFKLDDFRLKLISPEYLVLKETATVVPAIQNETYNVEVERTIVSSKNWSTFVLPFEISPDKLFESGECEVKELKSVTISDDNEHVKLVFGSIDGNLRANHPYIIRNNTETKLNNIKVQNVVVNTMYDENTRTVSYSDPENLMTFHGVYDYRKLPKDAFFINSNKFYKAVGLSHNNPDKIKGFRGYFELNTASEEQGARAFSFRIGEDETAVDEVNNEPATVVAIYNLSGMRLDGLQDGVNILQMSDGTSIKVIIE